MMKQQLVGNDLCMQRYLSIFFALEPQASLYFQQKMLTQRPFFFIIMLVAVLLNSKLYLCGGIPHYDTLGFAPSGGVGLAITTFGSRSDMKLMATVSSGSGKSQPVVISHRQATSFKEVAFLFCSDCLFATAISVINVRFNSDASSILVMTADVASSILRIYAISSSYTFTMIQKITLPAFSDILGISNDDNFLMVGSTSTCTVYKLTSGSYISIYSNSGASLNKACKVMTPDGLFILQDLGQTSTNGLYLHAYDGSSYVSVVEFNLGFLTSTIQRILIGQSDALGKYRILICSTVYVRYYELIVSTAPFSATLTLIQTLRNNATNKFDGYLTNNGLYAVITSRTAVNRQFTFLQYSPISNTYLQISTINGLLPEYPNSMFISEDGQFAAASVQSVSIYPVSEKQLNTGYFFFACKVNNCLKCSWLNVCLYCKEGYVLTNYTCGCSNGQKLQGDICVTCQNGECSASINSLAKITEQLKNMQIFIVIALIIIMTGFVLGFVYLSQKIKNINHQQETPLDHSKQSVIPQKSQITEFHKKSLSSSQMEIYKESSQFKISGMDDNLIGKQLPDDASNTPQVRRTRKKRVKDELNSDSPLEVKFAVKQQPEVDFTQSELN